MNAYQSILNTKIDVIIILFSIVISSFFLFKSSTLFRSMGVILNMWLPPIFYMLYIINSGTISFSIILALLLDVILLLFGFILFFKLLNSMSDKYIIDTDRLMKNFKSGLVVIIILSFFIYTQDNVGIFSYTNSRIDYLDASRLNLYATYMISVVSWLLIPLSVKILIYKKSIDMLVIFYIIIIILLSLLSGSKGSGVLKVIAIISLLKFKYNYFKIIFIPIVLSTLGSIVTISIVGNFYNLPLGEMIKLMYARFFLVNDTRALAIDYIGYFNASLFQESFRGIASLLHSPPVNMPIGQLLYNLEFSTKGLIGGNASSSALLILYGSEIEKIIFFVVIVLIAFCIFKATTYRGNNLIKISIGLLLIQYLSQDILAFQLILNILSVCLSLFFIGKKIKSIVNRSIVTV